MLFINNQIIDKLLMKSEWENDLETKVLCLWYENARVYYNRQFFLKTVQEDIIEKQSTKRPSEQPLPYVGTLSPKVSKIKVQVHAPAGK